VAQHRAGYELHDGHAIFGAQPDGRFLRRGMDPAGRPVVGDFVEVADGTPPHILAVAPRRSVLSRAAAGERYERQLIATNIDYVLVLTGLDGDFNPARIERYLSLTEDSGAQGGAAEQAGHARGCGRKDRRAARAAARRHTGPRAQLQGPFQRAIACALPAGG